MSITAEQAEQARDIIRETLDTHHEGRLPYRQVWTKPEEDFDGVPYLRVWVIYDGLPSSLNIERLNSYDLYLMTFLRKIGIDALTSISYVPETDLDELGTPWIG